MTEPLPPLTDEDLSLVLDGEASPDVVARVAADPAAQARLDALRGAGNLLRDTPVAPLDPGTVDQLVGRALDQATAPADDPDHSTDDGGAVVHPLPPRSRPGGVPRWLVAAAVVALVGIGLALVWSGRETDRNDTAAVSTEAGGNAEKAADADAGPGEDGAVNVHGLDPSSPATATTDSGAGSESSSADDQSSENKFDESGSGLVELGTFADADALREALKTSFAAGAARRLPYASPSAGGATRDAVRRCDEQLRTVLSINGAATNQGIATVGGEPVLVYEYPVKAVDDGSPTTLVAGVHVDACDPVVTFER